MTLTRRDFLKTSSIVGGGLLLGVSLPGTSGQAHAAGTMHAPNAWVHIADNNTITLLCARSEMGQGVYTALPMLIAEELAVDLTKVQVAIAPPGEAYKNALLGAQITGGSTSVRDGWEKLRVAGAQARMMLVAAAAARWQTSADKCRAENGMVTGPGGKKATYGELAQAASQLPLPTDVVLKDPKDFRIVGKATRRLDTPAKVNGSAEYGIDVRLPGMVYASLEQCPVIGGKVKRFDASRAKTMPGVIDVVQIPDGVAVVADSYWHAKRGRDMLEVEWDDGPGAALTVDAMMEGIRTASTGKAIPIKQTGDAASALKSAAKVIKAEYESPLLAHAAMEPMNFTADCRNGKVLLIGPTQFQQGAQGAVAAVLGVKPENITLKTTFLGGGFGRRLELDFIIQAAQISKAVNKPVKLIWSREDDTTHDFYRPMALHQLAAGFDAAGKPTALTFRLTSQSVTQRAFGLPKDTLDPFMAEAAVAPYNIPHTSQDLVIHDSGLRVGYWRSVSHALNAFANESFVDEMAAAAGKDPYSFRMDLLAGKPRFANVLKLAADKAGWGKALPKGHFHGIALMEGYDSFLAQVVEISMRDNEVAVHRVVAAADLGQMVNPDTVEAQIQSSIVFGLSAALQNRITLERGKVVQKNFDTYPVVRMHETPRIDVVLVKSSEKPGGVGEPATALVAPALANAVFAATGKRVRKLPLSSAHIAQA